MRDNTARRAQIFDELLRQIAHARIAHRTTSVRSGERSNARIAGRPSDFHFAIGNQWPRPDEKRGFATSSPAHASSDMESQPAAIMSASAVLPEPRAPIIATRPALSGITNVCIQGALSISTSEMTCDGATEVGGSVPT